MIRNDKKGVNMGIKVFQEKCNKCKQHNSMLEYQGGKYCTWYCAKKGDKQYGVFYEIRIDMAINRCVCTWVSWYSDIGQLVCVFDVLE